MPMTGLVQVSDYVLGDRTAPCRAVPGDGAIPLERILGDVLDAGYAGVFDLELVGPRIDAEGARPATTRAAETLSRMLTKLAPEPQLRLCLLPRPDSNHCLRSGGAAGGLVKLAAE